jgi:hypothetical protein
MDTERQDTEWIVIHTFEGDIFAEMISEALDNANIPNDIMRSMMSSGLGARSVSLAGGTAQLRVPEEYAEEAKAIVDDILSDKE